MEHTKDSDEEGPSVDSEDRDERITARRIRIAKRAEAHRRAQLGVDPDELKEVKEEPRKSRKQMEESRILLTKLVEDQNSLVTNVRVAAHAREGQRRIDEEEAKRLRREKLETEAKTGAERFEEITRKWEIAMQKEIPHELHEMLTQQRLSCDTLRDEKNKLIYDFEMELKQKDEQYVKDLKKMEKEIDLLSERNNEEVKLLTLSYRRELEQIEKAFVAERTELKEQYSNKWDAMMKERGEKEVNFMKACQKRVDDYESQLQHLRVMDGEEYCKTKIRVEKDLQVLQQQMQQMKATYQLNQEKLDYNFNVLRKRDEENTVTKSQQKRKITRIQDVLTNLRSKLAKQEKQYIDENAQLAEEYKRITEHLHDLQKKSKHFMATDAKKFRDIWIMNEEEAKGYVHKLMEADRIIHEQQLGLAWQSPDLEFMKNVGPLKDKKKKNVRSAKSVARDLLSSASAMEGEDDFDEAEGADGESRGKSKSVQRRLSGKVVKQILELLCGESDFLVESKLQTLLQPLQQDEQSLMKLDAVFAALGVETEEDVYTLSTYFVSHQSSGKKAGTTEEGPQGRERSAASAASASPSTTSLVHANEVIKGLRKFVEDNRASSKDDDDSKQFKLQALEERDASNDAAYWAMYPAVISGDRADLWDALTECFLKYSEILLARSTLINENDALRQQNAELRVLLHQYMASKVNQELQIPPTRVLHLDSGAARV